MIPEDLEHQVRHVVDTTVASLSAHFPEHSFPPISIQYERSYTTAGWAATAEYLVNFDPILLLANRDEFLKQIVPHEVAHVIADHVYGSETNPHGPEWKSVMVLLGLDPNPYHDLDTSLSKRKMTSYEFTCSCENGTYVHEYGAVMRRKILVNSGSCTDCLTLLKPIEPIHIPPLMPYKVAVGTKQDRAKWIIKKYKRLGRKRVIHKLMVDAGLTKAGANTYFYNLK